MATNQGPDQVLESDSYVTTDIKGAVKLRIPEGASAPENYTPLSVPTLLTSAAQETPLHPALLVKRDDKWLTWTYADYLKGNDEIRKSC